MNIYQRIVLILGAISLLGNSLNMAEQYWPILLIRILIEGIAIVVATLLVFYALKGLGRKKDTTVPKEKVQ